MRPSGGHRRRRAGAKARRSPSMRGGRGRQLTKGRRAETEEPPRRGVGEPVGADWARELTRALAADTSPRPQPASEQLVLAAPPPLPAQPRAEGPKLTIHRLDVQVINQPPAPTIQFMPPPV